MNERDTKLQSQYTEVIEQNKQLAKRNDGLERQIKEYGEWYMSEKEEKKGRIDKYDLLQSTNGTMATNFNKERTIWIKKYYTVLGILFVLSALLLSIAGYIMYFR